MSKVYWVDLSRMAFDNSVAHKLSRLLRESAVAANLSEGTRVALKVNTAEEGYEYGLRPRLIRMVASAAQEFTGARPTICDGLKLVDYWNNTKGHSFLHVARGKGYSTDTLGGTFVINGGFSGDEGNLYPCGRPDSVLGGVEVGAAVCRSDALWVLSHVTLHPLFGLAGALWNGGFECLVGRERTRVLDGVDAYSFNGAAPPAESLARGPREPPRREVLRGGASGLRQRAVGRDAPARVLPVQRGPGGGEPGLHGLSGPGGAGRRHLRRAGAIALEVS
jgi:hypothetical protein